MDNITISQVNLYKGRELDTSKPIEVYRNLHKEGKWYSIRQFGKVVAHTQNLNLMKCDLIVREAGRQKVIESGQKNVHAFIKGYYCSVWKPADHFEQFTLTYDPFTMEGFTLKEWGCRIHWAENVVIKDGQVLTYSTVARD